jgi:lysophospholipase L1-like esterase
MLVCFPTQSQFEAPAASTAPQERLAEWAARNRVPLLDLLPAYRRFAAAAPDERLYSDFLHPTARGHRVAAEELARFIDEKGILDVLLAGERRNSLGPSD